MNRQQLPLVRLFALIVVVVASLAFTSVSAQEAPAEIDFRIASFTCPSDPGQVSLAAGNIPDSCTPDFGAVASVSLEDGTVVGTCTTDASGLCTLQAPNEATVVVTLDDSTIAGTAVPRENPITTQVVTEFAGALFINVPTTGAPPEAPTELPNTGAGPSSEISVLWLYVGAVMILGVGGIAAGLRLQLARSTD